MREWTIVLPEGRWVRVDDKEAHYVRDALLQGVSRFDGREIRAVEVKDTVGGIHIIPVSSIIDICVAGGPPQ